MGTLFSVPVVQEASEATLTWLQQNGIAVVAATPHANKLYTAVDLTQPIAIAVGTELVVTFMADWMLCMIRSVKDPDAVLLALKKKDIAKGLIVFCFLTWASHQYVEKEGADWLDYPKQLFVGVIMAVLPMLSS